jgi:hypothetical protein
VKINRGLKPLAGQQNQAGRKTKERNSLRGGAKQHWKFVQGMGLLVFLLNERACHSFMNDESKFEFTSLF